MRDSGLCHRLLGIDSAKALLEHPHIGASWEGFVIEQILLHEPHDGAWFWATHQGAEIDPVLKRSQSMVGIECKRADAPRITRSIRSTIEDLGLEQVFVIYPGTRRYPMADSVEAVPLAQLTAAGGLSAYFP